MESDTKKRSRTSDQPAEPVLDESVSDELTEGESAIDNPAEINTTPDIAAFDPKNLPAK